VLGFGKTAQVALGAVQISPATPAMGGTVHIAFELTNTQAQAQSLLADLVVSYVKANGQANAKVFKLKTLELAPGQTVRLTKKLSLTEMTTRKHYPGVHQVAVMLNGRAQPLGFFELMNGR
jgi:plastocyanin